MDICHTVLNMLNHSFQHELQKKRKNKTHTRTIFTPASREMNIFSTPSTCNASLCVTPCSRQWQFPLLCFKSKACSAIKPFLCCKWITKTSPPLQLLIAFHPLPPLHCSKERKLQIINNVVGEKYDNLWISKRACDSTCINFFFLLLASANL